MYNVNFGSEIISEGMDGDSSTTLKGSGFLAGSFMNYSIEYAVLCCKGLVRKDNQDNFWCLGKFLNSTNDGLTEPITGMAESKTFPAFAVFDGIGGEDQGEVAAFIAANRFDAAYSESQKDNTKQFLLNTCSYMNNAICRHTEQQHLKSSGSTAAILMFGKKYIYVCNIGDSRVYQFSENELVQISYDHSETIIGRRKPPLTQSLGIPETEFIIEPYISKGKYESRDKYLICSDGLSDMVTDDVISDILSEDTRILDCAQRLMCRAIKSGGNDNITIIVCEIHKQRRFL